MKPSSPQKLVKQILDAGGRTEGIALALGVANTTVLRWRDGKSAPHPGHLAALQKLVDKSSATKKSSKS